MSDEMHGVCEGYVIIIEGEDVVLGVWPSSQDAEQWVEQHPEFDHEHDGRIAMVVHPDEKPPFTTGEREEKEEPE